MLRALRDIGEKSERNRKEYVLHSLMIGSPSTLAAGGDVAEQVIQRGGGNPTHTCKAFTRNSADDGGRVSRE